MKRLTYKDASDNRLAGYEIITEGISVERLKIICDAERADKLDISEYTRCQEAEKTSDGKCLGYQKSRWDDEPAEKCKECKDNIYYEE